MLTLIGQSRIFMQLESNGQTAAVKFSRLRLSGFKSFVDPTELVISDGLTGVVGPNGCGKSNLLEALRWVMGENRASAMRGAGMEDVIFAGSAARPARNHAEVSLQIDNADRLAPAGFNDTDQLDVVRRITRDVGSAYKANGKDVRARDVQMLFADASTGAHSPALVRQGQISALISAKPRQRRRILEEAAGISGLYQRRHEAELKLASAEQNLLRIEDTIDALAGQLASLARQAKAAQRYREINNALRQNEGILLYRRWRAADAQRLTAEGDVTQMLRAQAAAETALRTAQRARATAEDALPSKREEQTIAAAIVQRLIVQRDTLEAQKAQAVERISALKARLAQLDSDRLREENLDQDADQTIAGLEWEAGQIADAQAGQDAAIATAQAAAEEAADQLAELEMQLTAQTEDMARLSARYQSAGRLAEDSEKTAARALQDAQKAEADMEAAKMALTAAQAQLGQAADQSVQSVQAAEAAEKMLQSAEQARQQAQAAENTARSARAAAEAEASALGAEVKALAQLVARDQAAGSQVLDQIMVQDGFEAALGAALGDDLRAPVIAGQAQTGWGDMASNADLPPLPAGARAMADVVQAPAALKRRISQIGLVDPADGPLLQSALLPGQRLVSQAGDLWRWDGWVARAEDAPTAAAMRLKQQNRLRALQMQLDAARIALDAATADHAAAADALQGAQTQDEAARQARRDADRAVAEAARLQSRAEAECDLTEGRLEALKLAGARHQAEAKAASSALAKARAALAELPDLDSARAQIDTLRTQAQTARLHMVDQRSQLDALVRQATARRKRAQELTKELSGWALRRQTAQARLAELAQTKDQVFQDLAEAEAAPDELAAKRDELAQAIHAAQSRAQTASDALAQAETILREAQSGERATAETAAAAREARARAEARLDAAKDTVELAYAQIQEAQDCTPDDLLDRLDIDPGALPEPEAIEAEIARLRRSRDALGAVNLRAEEDRAEVAAEHDTLAQESRDLQEAISELRRGISGLNREGRARLLQAFEDVNRNFTTLFTHLFGGGEANLVLVESDDPLEAGLEIMCQPPGKKLAVLSLLSGGEQTLTALALIFAVFLANPAPICVLDEVDAPLDDANVTRFCDLLDEMCRRTQTRFLIITHHAVTMARMDRLFGVTMQEQGVSQLVSVDLKKAEEMVA